MKSLKDGINFKFYWFIRINNKQSKNESCLNWEFDLKNEKKYNERTQIKVDLKAY